MVPQVQVFWKRLWWPFFLPRLTSHKADFPVLWGREEEKAEEVPSNFQKGDTRVFKEGRPGWEKATPRQSHSEDCHQTMGSHFSLLVKSVLPLSSLIQEHLVHTDPEKMLIVRTPLSALAEAAPLRACFLLKGYVWKAQASGWLRLMNVPEGQGQGN